MAARMLASVEAPLSRHLPTTDACRVAIQALAAPAAASGIPKADSQSASFNTAVAGLNSRRTRSTRSQPYRFQPSPSPPTILAMSDAALSQSYRSEAPGGKSAFKTAAASSAL